MQRVLHVIGKMDRAGAETMLMNLYRTIDRENYQFDFIVFTKEKGDYDDEIISLGGRIIPIIAGNPIARTKLLIKFLKSNKEYKILHAHTLFSNAFHILAAKFAKIPVRIAHSHNTDDQSKGFVVSNIYKAISRSIINKFSTDRLACGKEAAVCLFGQDQNNVLILPNAIDSTTFMTIGKNNSNYINEKFQINPQTLKIVQIGRLQEVKNHKFSVKVANNLKKQGVDFKMLFVGKGDLSNDIKQEILDNDLTEDVIMTGLRTDIPQIMAGADVMIMPSLFEGFPVVLVESQAVGLPVIVSENVSGEVDLDLNLVDFLKLDETIWTENLKKFEKQKPDFERIKDIFYKEGFDINSAVERVRNLYSKAVNKNYNKQ
ncbi:MAG: glycosyltransferase family 1 protein [Chryseobacterium sp.]|nr:MAG: glycosyltransferase family 1 protein [Chryseobacterium sp.]